MLEFYFDSNDLDNKTDLNVYSNKDIEYLKDSLKAIENISTKTIKEIESGNINRDKELNRLYYINNSIKSIYKKLKLNSDNKSNCDNNYSECKCNTNNEPKTIKVKIKKSQNNNKPNSDCINKEQPKTITKEEELNKLCNEIFNSINNHDKNNLYTNNKYINDDFDTLNDFILNLINNI